jgi:hypothetical protein
MRSSDQGYLFFVDWLFGILKAWKSDSSSVLRPSAQGYVTTGGPYWILWCPENASPEELWDPELKATRLPVETFITIWRPENAITRVSWDCRPKGILHRQSLCSAFWWPENEILQGALGPCLKKTWYPLSNFSSIWRAKERFLPCR